MELKFFSDVPEKKYAQAMPPAQARRLGQYFTPFPVAEFMARWVLGNPRSRTILDPAVGLGVFFRACLQDPTPALPAGGEGAPIADKEFEQKVLPEKQLKRQFVGYDIDAQVLAKAKSLFTGCEHVNLVEKDYLFNDWEERYDGILCNPPYQRFQNYERRNEILQEFQARLGFALSGLTNLASLFLLKSVHQLAHGGRCAYILPSEFLNADYGTLVKRHLIHHGALRYVIIFDFTQTIFEEVLTTSCILLFAHDQRQRKVEFITLHSIEELHRLSEQLSSYPSATQVGKTVSYSELKGNIKWRAYYQPPSGGKYSHLTSLSSFVRVVRGIATGDNDYFTFSAEKARQYEIDDCFLLPCLTKAVHASQHFFTPGHFGDLRLQNKRVFLLNATNLQALSLGKYIAFGEESCVHRRFLTSHRMPWYALENRPPAPILVTVFNRKGMRFIRNEAGAYNLTCFHCVYPSAPALEKIDLLMAYLMTDLSKEIFSDNRREYGNGLEKFEPNDLNHAQVVDILALPRDLEAEILKLYRAYRASVIEKREEVGILAEINQAFLIYMRGNL